MGGQPFGGEGNDWIDGIDADDAADFLNGGAGQAILFAGKNDSLTGGHGADTFVIRLGDATEDTLPEITDFEAVRTALTSHLTSKEVSMKIQRLNLKNKQTEQFMS